MTKARKKLDWIQEWHQSSHTPLPIPIRPLSSPRFDLIKPGISTLAPPDFLKSPTPSSFSQSFSSPSLDFYTPPEYDPLPRPVHNRSYTPTPSPPKKNIRPNYQQNWFNEEISFVMNKLSIFGLVFGLMLLGTLLFIGGFLTAYAFYAKPNTPLDYNPWSTAHHRPLHQGAEGHTPYHSDQAGPPSHNYAAGVVGYALHRQASRLNSAVHIPHIGGGGFLAPATNRLNSNLQTKTHQGINAGSQQIMAPLNPKFYNRPEHSPSSYARVPYDSQSPSAPSSRYAPQQNHNGRNYGEKASPPYRSQNSYNRPYSPPSAAPVSEHQQPPYSRPTYYEQPHTPSGAPSHPYYSAPSSIWHPQN